MESISTGRSFRPFIYVRIGKSLPNYMSLIFHHLILIYLDNLDIEVYPANMKLNEADYH
jgi:hypothetical protein